MIKATMPKVEPNPALIKGLELMLAKARLGDITDGVLLGCGYNNGSAGEDSWFHHFSIERDDDVVTFVGELSLFLDVLKTSAHNARNRAAKIASIRSLGA